MSHNFTMSYNSDVHEYVKEDIYVLFRPVTNDKATISNATSFIVIQFFTCLIYCAIPSFRYSDNSVHLHECSPCWVGIFITFNKETTMFTVLCRHAHFN